MAVSVSAISAAQAVARPTLAELLFQPIKVGRYDLPHRIVMAPLPRSRSRQPGNVPTALSYYAQRASAALIVSEATLLVTTAVHMQRGRDLPDLPEAWLEEDRADLIAFGRRKQPSKRVEG